jgi:hypothetical protein
MAGPMTHAELAHFFDGLETQLPGLLARCQGTGERVRAFERATAPLLDVRLADADDARYARRRLQRLLLAAGLAADEALEAPPDLTPSC